MSGFAGWRGHGLPVKNVPLRKRPWPGRPRSISSSFPLGLISTHTPTPHTQSQQTKHAYVGACREGGDSTQQRRERTKCQSLQVSLGFGVLRRRRGGGRGFERGSADGVFLTLPRLEVAARVDQPSPSHHAGTAYVLCPLHVEGGSGGGNAGGHSSTHPNDLTAGRYLSQPSSSSPPHAPHRS